MIQLIISLRVADQNYSHVQVNRLRKRHDRLTHQTHFGRHDFQLLISQRPHQGSPRTGFGDQVVGIQNQIAVGGPQ